MAAPVTHTLRPSDYLAASVGSGSNGNASVHAGFGTPTAMGRPDLVYYPASRIVHGRSSSGSPVNLLQTRPDPVGSWLASTAGILPETDNSPPGTYARALNDLKASLGVTLTYIAKSLGMQRSAVYKWYEGRQPHAANRSRLNTVSEFAASWRAARLPSLRNYWETPVPGTHSTLGQLLSAEALNVDALRHAIDTLVRNTAAMPPKAPRLGFPRRPHDRQADREHLSLFIPSTSSEGDDDDRER